MGSEIFAVAAVVAAFIRNRKNIECQFGKLFAISGDRTAQPVFLCSPIFKRTYNSSSSAYIHIEYVRCDL